MQRERARANMVTVYGLVGMLLVSMSLEPTGQDNDCCMLRHLSRNPRTKSPGRCLINPHKPANSFFSPSNHVCR